MQTKLRLSRVWLGIGWLLVALVLYLSLTPHPLTLFAFENADKLEHACAYAALSFWFCQFYRQKWSRARVMLALLALGVAIEYVQGWTGYRTFDVLDMLADGVGVLGGWLLVLTPLGRVLMHIERFLVR